MLKKNLYSCFFTFFSIFFASAQVVINEIDTDTPSTDELEFVELKSDIPNFSLNGYVLAFYNAGSAGTGNALYYVVDLAGLTTDINGLAVIGNRAISPAPNIIIPNNTIQNGADVIALYRASITDFVIDAPATKANLIDAIAYTTSSGKTLPTTIMQVLGIENAYNENANSKIQTQSLQRTSTGTFVAKEPTPFLLNDGSGIPFSTIKVIENFPKITEGDAFTITLELSEPATSTYSVSLSLTNENFTTSDFQGNLSFTFVSGQVQSSQTITVLNDGIEEGDEEMKITFTQVPANFKINKNDIFVRVHDAQAKKLGFGRPTQPTYTYVENTIPDNYYSSAYGLTGETLRLALQNIIADSTKVRKHTYGDAVDILKAADQDPENSSNVWLMYAETSRSKIDYQSGETSSIGKWNREHIFPQSRGGFSNGTSTFADGFDIWEKTSATDLLAGHSDAHHIRPEDTSENSSRGNKNFGEYVGPNNTLGSWKGDVSRAVFYMVTRYNGFTMVNGTPANPSSNNNSTLGQIGDMQTLLNWHTEDPADDYEKNRNNYIYTWQLNRNPFIDYPELVDYIWGNKVGTPWKPTNLSVTDANITAIKLYPNPSTNYFTITGIHSGEILVYNATGSLIFTTNFTENTAINHNLTKGFYIVEIKNKDTRTIQKVLVK